MKDVTQVAAAGTASAKEEEPRYFDLVPPGFTVGAIEDRLAGSIATVSGRWATGEPGTIKLPLSVAFDTLEQRRTAERAVVQQPSDTIAEPRRQASDPVRVDAHSTAAAANARSSTVFETHAERYFDFVPAGFKVEAIVRRLAGSIATVRGSWADGRQETIRLPSSIATEAVDGR